jgi:hypothetical protein
MKTDELEKLIQERTLLKQLIAVNPDYKTLFSARIQEIKMKVNSEYAPIPNAEITIFMFQQDLADKISKNARETLKDLIELI